MAQKILLIDGNTEHATQVCEQLRNQQMEVSQVSTIELAIRQMALYRFDVIALNSLTEGAHFVLSLLFDLRQAKHTLLLTYPIPDANDRANLLNRGFDMCLPKEAPKECVAAIKALLRKPNVSEDDCMDLDTGFVVYKEFAINPLCHKVTMRGKDITFSMLEFKMLYLLASNPGITFSIDRIYDRVRGEDSSYGSEIVRNHIYSIRKKLGLSARDGSYIKTINGARYRFGG